MTDVEMTEVDSTYQLRCSLHGHTADVRSVACTASGDVLTASRDGTARLWRQEGREFVADVTYSGTGAYVMCVIYVAPSTAHPEGLVLAGYRDRVIKVFLPHCGDAVATLQGHTDAVSCMAHHGSSLISGSWDHSALLWTLAAPYTSTARLSAHSGPVWAVLALEDGSYLTAGADKCIMQWRDGKVSRKLLGHTDCVRSMVLHPTEPHTLLSCSNDASIRLWSLEDGSCTNTLYGHTNFIYSLCVVPAASPTLASASEDRTVRVWAQDSANTTHTLPLPCVSVWAVAGLPCGDVVAGGSDGAVRVWTKVAERRAGAEERAAWAEQLASTARPAHEVDGMDTSKIPDASALLIRGTKSGETKMVREGGKVMCYSWAGAEWTAVGEVVGSDGGGGVGGKAMYQGREYDFVFSVEIDDEGRTLKLPFNKSDDPWQSAQTFINTHALPQSQLEEVATFIITNSGGGATKVTTSQYRDPLTGGSSYVPGTDTNSGGGGTVDPFTADRYVPGSDTGADLVPLTSVTLFTNVNLQGISDKLRAANAVMPTASALSTEELDSLLAAVSPVASGAAIDHVAAMEPLLKALQWPAQHAWPALDLLKSCVRQGTVQDAWLEGGPALLPLLTALVARDTPTPAMLMTLRCLANLGAHPPGATLLLTHRDEIASAVASLAPLPKATLEVAAVTVLANLAFLSGAVPLSDACQLLSALATLLLTGSDGDALHAACVAMGTLLVRGGAEVRQFASALELGPALAALASGAGRAAGSAGALARLLG